MNLLNAIVSLDPTRLDRDSATLNARQLRALTVGLRNVPDDVTSLKFRMFPPGASGFVDVPAGRRPDGTAVVHLIGTLFSTVGTGSYEIHADDALGHAVALASGKVTVAAFSSPTATGGSASEEVRLQTVTDRSGVSHYLVAVPDDTGNYTIVIE